VVENVLAEPSFPFPILSRIVMVPVFAADGSLQIEPGYHAASRMLYEPEEGFTMPPLPDGIPSEKEIEVARKTLCDDLLGHAPVRQTPSSASAEMGWRTAVASDMRQMWEILSITAPDCRSGRWTPGRWCCRKARRDRSSSWWRAPSRF
jgi:hypothetical protein